MVICDVHEERLAQTAKELGELGPLASFVVDITVEKQVQQLFDDVAARFGKVDILINNAGLPDRFQPVGDVDMDLWDKVIAVNLTAPVLMSKFAVKSMATGTTGGCIINMASVASKAGVLSGMCSHIFAIFSLGPGNQANSNSGRGGVRGEQTRAPRHHKEHRGALSGQGHWMMCGLADWAHGGDEHE